MSKSYRYHPSVTGFSDTLSPCTWDTLNTSGYNAAEVFTFDQIGENAQLEITPGEEKADTGNVTKLRTASVASNVGVKERKTKSGGTTTTGCGGGKGVRGRGACGTGAEAARIGRVEGKSGRHKKENKLSGSAEREVGGGKGMKEEGKGRKGRSAGVGNNKEEMMRRFKLDVVRKLLSTFQLDETIERCRQQSVRSFKIKPAEFSVDCSMSAYDLKDRLCRLTGSDELRFNDRQYRRRVEQVMKDEYQKKIDQEAEERSKSEMERVRRLMRQGVITVKEMEADECFMDMQRTLTKTTPVYRESYSSVSTVPQYRATARCSNAAGRGSLQPEASTGRKMGVHSDPDAASDDCHETRSAFETESWQRPEKSCRERIRDSSGQRARHHNLEKTDRFRSSGAKVTNRFSKYQHPLMNTMRQAKSVSELYQQAARIVPLH